MRNALKILLYTLHIVALVATPATFSTVTASPINGIPQELPRIVLTRWPDSSSFAHQTFLKEVPGGRYLPFFQWENRLHHSDYCESLLMAAQLFPLEIMAADNYITAEQKAQLLRLGERLNSGIFRFAELLQVVEGDALNGRIFDARLGHISPALLGLMQPDRILATQATLWTAAGQTATAHSSFSLHAMPWQLDPEFAHISLDRHQHRMTWEIGRGAQNQAKSVDILFRAHALAMLNDVYAFGENLDNAYVFIHTLGEGQARLTMMRRNPRTNEPVFTRFASHGEGLSNVIFRARLRDLLETMPPDNFSERIYRVREASQQRLDWLGAFEHLHAARSSMRQDLEFIHPENQARRAPIILRNTTPIVGWFMASVSRRYGIFDHGGPQIAAYLSQSPWLEHHRRGPQIVDLAVPETREIAQAKLFGISNLDPEIAKKDPNYTLLVLFATYHYYERQLLAHYPRETAEILAQTAFVINSSHPEIIEQAQAIPGAMARTFTAHHESYRLDAVDGNSTIQPRIEIVGGPGFIFRAQDVGRLLQTNPGLSRRARHALRSGGSQTEQLLGIVY